MDEDYHGLLFGFLLLIGFAFLVYLSATHKPPTENEILQSQNNNVINCKNYCSKLGTLKFSYNRQTYCTCNFGK